MPDTDVVASRPAIRILGSLEADGPGGPVRLGAAKERCLLTVLVVHAGAPVRRDLLVDALWEGSQPPSAVNAVQNYVLRLRRALSVVDGLQIATEPVGYRLLVDRGTVDAAMAEDLIDEGRAASAAGDPARAERLFRDALKLWRGPSLAEFADHAFAAGEAARLDELRESAREDLVDVELALGRPRRALGMLETMVKAQPLRERRWAQRMLALYRDGRQADALEAFATLRCVLAEELGIDPGSGLQELRDRILRQDASLELIPGLRAAGDGPTTAAVTSNTFFGREQELDRLVGRYEAAASGDGGLVTVVGEPGIGKTSLLRAFAGAVRARSALVLVGRCLEGGWLPPYHPFAEAIGRWTASLDPDRLRNEIGGALGVLAPLVPRLGELTGDGDRRARLQPDEERLRLLDGVAQFLVGLAARRPVVVVVDDLHWADASTVQMLRHAARSAPGQRLLIVGAYRSGEADFVLVDALGALRTETDLTTVRLHGLSTAAMRQLLSANASATVSETLTAAITTETRGNPFFAREVIRYLLEEGVVKPNEEGSLVGDTLAGVVPEGVRQVLGRRRARLSAEANRLLDTAAAFDGPFRFAIISEVAGLDDTAALAALDEIIDAELVEPDRTPERYQFQHALIRQAVYGDLNPSRRLRMHRKLAEALAAARSDPAARVAAAEVASQYHASAALPGADGGVSAAVDAADEAEAAAAHGEAAQFLATACSLARPGDVRLLPIRNRLGLELAWAQRFDEAVPVAGAAADALAAEHGPERAVAYLADVTAALTGADSAPHAWPLAAQGLRYAGDRHDRSWALLMLHDLDRQEDEDPEFPGMVLDHPQRREALRVLLDTGGVGDRVDLARFAVAAVHGRRDRIPADAAQDPTVRLFLLGDYAGALPLFEERARIAHGLGQLALEGYCRGSAARCHIALGDLDAGQAGLAEERRIAQRIGRGLWGWQRLQLTGTLDGLAHALDSGWEGVLTHVTDVFGPGNPAGRRLEAAAAGSAAKAAARLGRKKEAVGWLEKTLPALRRAPAWAMNFLRTLCDAVETVWLLGGHPCRDMLEDAVRTKALAADFRFPMMDARLALARLCSLDGRHTEARQWFAAARTVLEAEQARPLRAIVDFDEAVMHLRIGALDDGRELRDAALRQFEALGMVGWVARAGQIRVGAQDRVDRR